MIGTQRDPSPSRSSTTRRAIAGCFQLAEAEPAPRPRRPPSTDRSRGSTITAGCGSARSGASGRARTRRPANRGAPAEAGQESPRETLWGADRIDGQSEGPMPPDRASLVEQVLDLLAEDRLQDVVARAGPASAFRANEVRAGQQRQQAARERRVSPSSRLSGGGPLRHTVLAGWIPHSGRSGRRAAVSSSSRQHFSTNDPGSDEGPEDLVGRAAPHGS